MCSVSQNVQGQHMFGGLSCHCEVVGGGCCCAQVKVCGLLMLLQGLPYDADESDVHAVFAGEWSAA